MNWTNVATELVVKAIKQSDHFRADVCEMVSTSPNPDDHVLNLCEYVELKMIEGNTLTEALIQPTLESINWEQIAHYFINHPCK